MTEGKAKLVMYIYIIQIRGYHPNDEWRLLEHKWYETLEEATIAARELRFSHVRIAKYVLDTVKVL